MVRQRGSARIAGQGVGSSQALAPPTFVTWFWSQPDLTYQYQSSFVLKLRDAIASGYPSEHRFLCVSDDYIPDVELYPLWDDCREIQNISGAHWPSCYRRLKLFSGKTTDEMGIARGSRVISIDLDMLVTGDLRPLFDRTEDFLGWRVPGADHPVVFNGSVYMFQAGEHEHIWEEFDPSRSPKIAQAAGFHGSDQGWISYCMIGSGVRSGWAGKDGLYGWRAIRHHADSPPDNCRLVSFCGRMKQWHIETQEQTPWIKEYWRS